jgi:hypothetical protein
MKALVIALFFAGLSLPVAASAQSNDAKYCTALSEMYDAYIETAGDKGGRATPTEVVIAMDRCKSDPARSIPVLEKQLKAAKLTLPPRG